MSFKFSTTLYYTFLHKDGITGMTHRLIKCVYWDPLQSNVTSPLAQQSGSGDSMRRLGILVFVHCFGITTQKLSGMERMGLWRLTEACIEPVVPQALHSANETSPIHSAMLITLGLINERTRKRHTRTSICSELSCDRLVSRFFLQQSPVK
jgi:hypothetical protein